MWWAKALLDSSGSGFQPQPVTTENSVFGVGASFAALRLQLAVGDRWDRVGNVRTTTHRSWSVTCEGAEWLDGRIVERPPLPDEGKRRWRPRGLGSD
jgi:hypothetical protein